MCQGCVALMGMEAVWTARYINSLPDSAFAWIESGGKKDKEGKTVPRSLRHLPHHDKMGKVDLPHLRNALARLPQMSKKPPASSRTHLQKHMDGAESSSRPPVFIETLEGVKVSVLTEVTAEGFHQGTVLFTKGGGTVEKPVFLNRNNRLYPTELWKREVARVKEEEIANGAFVGQNDHPFWFPSMNDVSVKFTDIYWVEEDNAGYADFIFLETERGKHLYQLARAEVGLGVSTRGYGSSERVKIKLGGVDVEVDVVQDDYKMDAIDFTLEGDQSVPDAGLLSHESTEDAHMYDELTLAELESARPDLLQEARADLQAQVTALLAKAEELKTRDLKLAELVGGQDLIPAVEKRLSDLEDAAKSEKVARTLLKDTFLKVQPEAYAMTVMARLFDTATLTPEIVEVTVSSVVSGWNANPPAPKGVQAEQASDSDEAAADEAKILSAVAEKFMGPGASLLFDKE